MDRRFRWLAIAFAALPLLAPGASAQVPEPPAPETPDWEAVSDVEVIHALTTDEDGSQRETKIWFVVVDGQGFIRTGSSRWGENLERDPNLLLRIEEREYPLRADFVEDAGFRERIEQAFREKYGWSDGFIGIFRGGNAKIMHMAPR